MKAHLLVVLLLTIAYHAEGNCPDDPNGQLWTKYKLCRINNAILLCQTFHLEYLYGCKAVDEEGQDLSCTCMKLQQKGKFNCTCFADDQVEVEEHYLNCHDALKKSQLQSGVYDQGAYDVVKDINYPQAMVVLFLMCWWFQIVLMVLEAPLFQIW